MHRQVSAALIATLGVCASVTLAQAPGRGPLFQANSYTSGGQNEPSVATTTQNGDFVIVWDSFQQEGSGAGRGIFGRVFDPLGNPLTGDFQVNTYTFSDQSRPRVAGDAAGNFVVVWDGYQGSNATPSDPVGVGGRVFDSGGGAISPAFTVNDPTADPEQRPAVSMSEVGFVVAFHRTVPLVTSVDVFAQRYEPDGDRISGNFQVNTYNAFVQKNAEVAIDSDGKFFITWVDENEFGTDTNIRGRAYDAAGNALTGDFIVNTYTTGFQYNHSVAPDGNGGFVVAWNDNFIGYPLRAQRYDGSGNPSGPETVIGSGFGPRIVRRSDGGFVVFSLRASGSTVDAILVAKRYDDNLNLIGSQFELTDINLSSSPAIPSVAADNGRHLVFAWQDATDGSGNGIVARRGGYPEWAPYAVDERAPGGGLSNQNGVAEVNERFTVDSALTNHSGVPYDLDGTASNLVGPAGPLFTIHDGSADFGTIAAAPTGQAPAGGSVQDCFTATGNCYEFEITGVRTPGVHWDATYDEALSEGVSVTRTLHIGESFLDVPATNIFYRFIENLFHNGITAGGSCGGYCPTENVLRQQMAVFLLKSRLGAGYVPPPAAGTVFTDVPVSNPFAPWIEDLFNRGITGGCVASPPQYCPTNPVNRQQMAVFLLRTEEGSVYTPPACAEVFTDVACPSLFADWVEELYNRQITGGCLANPPQYCPTNPTNRQQMAVFLVKTFELVLYGL